MSSAPPRLARVRVRIRGVVQGVGFRPHVFRQAERFGLSGWVLNDPDGVLLEAEGSNIEGFLQALEIEAPPLARISGLDVEAIECGGAEAGFAIRTSTCEGPARIPPPLDTAVCAACLAELRDPGSRYHDYPFLNCTDCGPRYTLIRALPYDRAMTSMAPFAMCPECRAEYDDPRDRRFHAQPTACPACGPQLSMPPAEITRRLRAGEILALKGIGGFHLACDARQAAAVERLRRIKERDAKPFAVMVANLASARLLVDGVDEVASTLAGPERPIVLLPRHDDLPSAVAPGLPWLGIMLPYAPLHHLLFAAAAPEAPCDLVLVMTSANLSGEPLIVDETQARDKFGGQVDAIVTHDRAIVVGVDDAVVRPGPAGMIRVRPGRGHAPLRIKMGREIPPLVALGGGLKATVCLVRGDEAFVSQHLGDLDELATLRAYERALTHLQDVLAVSPEHLAHDLHPDLASVQLARRSGLTTHAVQHHHAHVAAVMAEHGCAGPVLGLALDGFGLGPEGQLWGGELLRVERSTFRHLGGLRPLPLPGGDAAAREPWRMGAAALHVLGRGAEIPRRFAEQSGAELLMRMLETGTQTPSTSSAGRLFDAVAGLLGILPQSSYEGQAAMMLEGLVRVPRVDSGLWRTTASVLDCFPLLAAVSDCASVEGAELFHGTLAAALVDWVSQHAAAEGIRHVVLSGGCFLNQVLTHLVARDLGYRGLEVLTARELPPSDAGLSLGQAWVAAFRIEDQPCA